MKISELNQPYRDLALMRQEQAGNAEYGADAYLWNEWYAKLLYCHSFIWDDSAEGYHFWNAINNGGTPDISSSSLAELEAWRKANGIPVENENSDDMCFHECPNCNDRCYCSAQPCSCCTQDEPDYKGLYEQRTAQFNELLAKYENSTPSRNWVAECALRFAPSLGVASWDYAEAWAAEGKKRGHI